MFPSNCNLFFSITSYPFQVLLQVPVLHYLVSHQIGTGSSNCIRNVVSFVVWIFIILPNADLLPGITFQGQRISIVEWWVYKSTRNYCLQLGNIYYQKQYLRLHQFHFELILLIRTTLLVTVLGGKVQRRLQYHRLLVYLKYLVGNLVWIT